MYLFKKPASAGFFIRETLLKRCLLIKPLVTATYDKNNNFERTVVTKITVQIIEFND